MIALRKEAIPVVTQSPLKVWYEGEVIGEYSADMLVDHKNCRDKSGQKISRR